MTLLTPAEARARLHAAGEIAFLDVREAGQFGEGHPLFAVPAPYSRIEALIGGFVPRLTADILLIDGGDGVAERAAARLERLGYANVFAVAGGALAWGAAGFPLYKGVNVPSKTLGELAEAVWHPQTLRPEELAAWRARGEDFAFFDARSPQEHAQMRVPGSRCLPNGELAHRLEAVAPSGSKPIVITCAGRTRGLVGAIGLHLAGYAGPIYALKNGTQGWFLAGFDLERGNEPQSFPNLGADDLAAARGRAERLIARFGIPQVSSDTVGDMLAERERTTYLLDVRSAPEALADPAPAAVHAPSGQLVQATDQWVGVRRARLILLDDGGLRAALAAFWLKQLGYDPAVVVIDDSLRALPPPTIPTPPHRAELAAAAWALRRLARGGARLLDLRPSLDYRRSHAAGAVWTSRPKLPLLRRAIARQEVFVVSETRTPADLAAQDLHELGATRVFWIEGGLSALVAAGAPVQASHGSPSDAEAIDHLFFVHDRHHGNREASRRYLEWETGLVSQLDEIERAEFKLLAPER